MWHPKKNLDPFLPVFSHFFMSYFDVLGSIFEKWPMTDLPNIIVSMCLVSYNFCMIPHVWALTFGLNLSGAWGVRLPNFSFKLYLFMLKIYNCVFNKLKTLFVTHAGRLGRRRVGWGGGWWWRCRWSRTASPPPPPSPAHPASGGTPAPSPGCQPADQAHLSQTKYKSYS